MHAGCGPEGSPGTEYDDLVRQSGKNMFGIDVGYLSCIANFTSLYIISSHTRSILLCSLLIYQLSPQFHRLIIQTPWQVLQDT